MTFLRDMDKESGEYMAAVDQALVHCRDDDCGIRKVGIRQWTCETEPAIAAVATFPLFIKGLENEAGIKIDFVVEPHTLSIHKLYVRFVQESALLYRIVAAASMALVSSKEEAPFSATDMIDELLRSYHKKTEAMALVLAQEVLLHGQVTDPDDSELEYLSAKSSQEEDEEDEEEGQEGEEGSEGEEGEEGEENDGLSDNEEAIMDLAHASAELGLDKDEDQERDELAEELKGLMMDAADLQDGLEELKHIGDQMRASGGSMALPPPIKEEPKEASPSSSSAGSSASEGKRKRVQ